MPDHTFELLDEFVVRYRRGEEPELRDYLARAGEQADELAHLVNRFLRAVPAPEPSADAVVLARAWADGQPPLLGLRVERGIKREELVNSLRERLGLAPDLYEKLHERYHELETGQLNPAPVDRRVWEALADALHARVDDLRAWVRPLPPLEAQVLYRATAPRAAMSQQRLAEDLVEPDEVDRLFGLS